jgi:hypothetical protein
MSEFLEITNELKELRKGESAESKLGWYIRHIPKESLENYNDYKLSVSKKMVVEEESDINEQKIETEVQGSASICVE